MTNQAGELLQDRMQYKWITAADQHEDRPGQTLLTRDHAAIRAWAKARGAEPATGVGKVDINDGGAAIRFAFPGVGRLNPISWDDWFQNFDEHHLVFVFEEHTDEGVQSNKYRLIRTEQLAEYGAAEAPGSGDSGNAATAAAESASPRNDSDLRRDRSPGDNEQPPAGSRKTGWRRALSFLAPGGVNRSSPGRR